MKKVILIICAILCLPSVWAQHSENNELLAEKPVKKNKRAWELGIGGALINWNRVAVTGFQNLQDGYLYNLKAEHLMGGVNLYVARELNRWFYLDLQGTMGMAKNHHRTPENDNKHNFLYMGGLGLQWRLSPMFRSKYVEPYLRVGMNYLHKDFDARYSGIFYEDPTGKAHWEATDTWNKNGREKDKDSFFPLSLGAGVNAWLNNSLGLGLQGEYLMPLQKNLPRFAQITLRVMWRIGGHDKRPAPVVQYVEIDRPVERIVERIVEKEVRVPAEQKICDMFDNVNFEFDKYALTAESETILDKAAEMLKEHRGSRFLITGFTDARGTDAYNLRLSRNRAKAVVDALVKRGVPAEMLKSRGVGKRAVSVPASESVNVRLGDRKVTIERITKSEYWNKLPQHQD
ncbi:OmpA family protein [Bacteroides pyogenes]|uniref:OmpA family protein n=1 Tax=Bacteroides pyogenes TaxID=310300 RepID=UPI00054D5BD4|nr:OmpA family protein [Bacteroides pyogenes]MBB3893884.1 outer membrane protein OmpA-like peptidoglycan-associated protein [Bacteroides pyogenes]SUV33918.1 putative outer membrane protein [Bacteroides pyogenes]